MDAKQKEIEKYDQLVKELSPNSKMMTNCLKAFCVGGTICVIGQIFNNVFTNMGLEKTEAGLWTSITLVFISVLLTGLGLYEKIGKFAGAGSIVPITGFANAVAAPALEFKKEGFITGLGAKLFILAGPVITYGTITSVLVGLVYYIGTKF